MQWRTKLACALSMLALATATPARAEVVRFSYKPGHSCGTAHTALKVGADGATGAWRASLLSPVTQSYYCQLTATHMVTFRHPTSCQNVSVPIAFPQGTPLITYQSTAIVYTYTAYTVRVEFLADGSVDVVYNSGLFRPLQP